MFDRRKNNRNKNYSMFDLAISFFHPNIFAGFNFAKKAKTRAAKIDPALRHKLVFHSKRSTTFV